VIVDLVAGASVAVIAGAFGFLELMGRHPQYAGRIVRTKPGRQYLLVNVVAGVVAYVIAMLLEVKFREPERPLLILACACTAMAVLRSAPVTRADLQGPVQVLERLKDAFTAELDLAAKEMRAATDSQRADEVTEAITGLTWDTDREALAAMCLMISKHYDEEGREHVAQWIRDAEETDLSDQVALFGLASWLREEYTTTVLVAAAKRVRAGRG
jgi:hypothetical protein